MTTAVLRWSQSIGTKLGINVLKPTQASGTRWLPHISRALKVLVTPGKDGSAQYSVVVYHMDHLSTTSRNADIKGRAKFVALKMRSVKFAAFSHFLADMFAIVAKLSLKMQKNDLILPVAVSSIRETVANVESLKIFNVTNGHLQRFLNMVEESEVADEVEFQRHTLCGSLDGTLVSAPAASSHQKKKPSNCLTGLTERFGNLLSSEADTSKPSSYGVTEVVNDLLVFNVDAWPNNVKDLVAFGNYKIERLTNWFRPVLEKAGCDVALIPEEWLSLKVQVNSGFWDKDYESLWQTMLTKMPYKQDYQNLLHLVEILLVLPISAAQCERAISAQNRIKSNLRVTSAHQHWKISFESQQGVCQ